MVAKAIGNSSQRRATSPPGADTLCIIHCACGSAHVSELWSPFMGGPCIRLSVGEDS